MCIRDRRMTAALAPADATSAVMPSMSSVRDGGSRPVAASSMISGATVRMPSASDANQCCQVDRIGAVELWKYRNPAVPVSYTHLRAHETPEHLVCRLLLEKKKQKN